MGLDAICCRRRQVATAMILVQRLGRELVVGSVAAGRQNRLRKDHNYGLSQECKESRSSACGACTQHAASLVQAN